MALVAVASRQVQAVGNFTEIAVGVSAGAGTTEVITVPSLTLVQGVICGGNTSTTVAYCDTISVNTFTITKASGDIVSWLAWGKARI